MENQFEDVFASSVNTNNTKTEQPTENPIADPSTLVSKAVSSIDDIKLELDKTKSLKEQAKDVVDLAATSKAVQDEKLVDDITNLKKEELKTNAESSLKEEQVKSKETEKKLQEANYGVYNGIATLIGLKKPLPNPMLKALMWILSPFLVLYYFIIGLITGIINITMDCINSIVIRFAEFTKPAKKIILFVLLLAVVGSIIITIVFLLKKYGVIQ